MGNKTKGNHDFCLFLCMSAVRRIGIYEAARTHNQSRLAVGEGKAASGWSCVVGMVSSRSRALEGITVSVILSQYRLARDC